MVAGDLCYSVIKGLFQPDPGCMFCNVAYKTEFESKFVIHPNPKSKIVCKNYTLGKNCLRRKLVLLQFKQTNPCSPGTCELASSNFK